ncbi:MAG: polysaccharide biosynthesis/export family protein, partial [Gammaproteobacteria bacterium]|nr:polysaccharide biosynthesis/export family protein [Gammaproteobacteria bacterium]
MPELLAGLLLAAVLLSGCASTPPLPADSGLPSPNPPASLARDTATDGSNMQLNQQKTATQQLHELEQFLASNKASFSLGKGDVLSISVYDEPDLT